MARAPSITHPEHNMNSVHSLAYAAQTNLGFNGYWFEGVPVTLVFYKYYAGDPESYQETKLDDHPDDCPEIAELKARLAEINRLIYGD